MKGSLHTALAAIAQGWWQKRGLMAHLLYPLSCLTRRVVSHRQRPSAKAHAWKAPVPVVVIGNIYVGGTGKTPVVIACAKALRQKGWIPGVVSRGYGVEIGPTPRVTQGLADPGLFGDEPALIAHETKCPIAVHPRRKLAIEALLASHPEVNLIISDDGLQHVEMARDMEIVVQDERGVGNGWLLPAGPLREPASRLDEVDVVITRRGTVNTQADSSKHETSHPVTRHLDMTLMPKRFRQVRTGQTRSLAEMLTFAHGKSRGAAAGIGVPQRFFETLTHSGLSLSQTRPLPDHAGIDAGTFADMPSDLIFITTKDAVKCRSHEDERLWALEVEPCFTEGNQAGCDGAEFFSWLDQRLRTLAVKQA